MPISATCYYRNGTIAYDDTPCSDSPMCCRLGDACMTNGLCRDKNNHPNGSLTIFGVQEYNFTGLYATASCQERSYQNCSIECSTYSSSSFDYVWACNTGLTSYCCHDSSLNLAQRDCCNNGTFTLPSPTVLGVSATSTTSNTRTSVSINSNSSTSYATSTSSTNTQSHNSSSSLSTATKIGIGLGVTLGVLGCISAATCFVRRYKRKKQPPKQPLVWLHPDEPITGDKVELCGEPLNELPGSVTKTKGMSELP
ncbi:hypothetical protein F1880_009838 [Penicillium rolfsii]|nr:hypothetical protein F1880_009838 [Penicillium rolfsii]